MQKIDSVTFISKYNNGNISGSVLVVIDYFTQGRQPFIDSLNK